MKYATLLREQMASVGRVTAVPARVRRSTN